MHLYIYLFNRPKRLTGGPECNFFRFFYFHVQVRAWWERAWMTRTWIYVTPFKVPNVGATLNIIYNSVQKSRQKRHTRRKITLFLLFPTIKSISYQIEVILMMMNLHQPSFRVCVTVAYFFIARARQPYVQYSFK